MTTLNKNLIFQAVLILATLLWKWSHNETAKNAFLWYLTFNVVVYGVFFIKWFIFWKGDGFP